MRLADWEERFAQLVHESQLRAFKWGAFDCCTFAADAVEALTGDDPMRHLRGQYRTWRGAAVLVRRLGGLRQAVVDVLGAPMPHPAMAQRGDVVLVRGEQAPALGVVVGSAALVPLQTGMQRIALGDWLAAWRVD